MLLAKLKKNAAYNAGLKAGDKIEAVNGTKTADWNNVVTEISGSKGKELKLEVSRSGKSETLSVTPKKWTEVTVLALCNQ